MAFSATPTNLTLAGLILACGIYSLWMVLRTHLPWRRWRLVSMAIIRVLLLVALAAWALDLTVGLPGLGRSAEVVVLVDRSTSVSAQGQAMADQRITHARSALGDSRVTVIEAGRQRRGGSPLAEGLSEAAAAFHTNGERRLLLLSDGMATTADLSSAAAILREKNIHLLAQPIDTLAGESLVADLSVPAVAWQTAPVPVEITLRSATGGPSTITMSIDGKVTDRRDVTLQRGQNVIQIPATFAAEGTHLVEVHATFGTDVYDWDNSAAALVYVPLAPRVALLTGNTAAAAGLDNVLRGHGIQVRSYDAQSLPDRLDCDCLVLDNVPAESLGKTKLDAIEKFAAAGGGIVFTGGPSAYAAGGYRNSPLEGVFPVLLEPKKEHIPYAMIVVLDNSWSMNEGVTSNVGKIDLAKEIAIAAVEGLSKGDWLSLVSFDSDYHNIINPTKVEDLEPAKYEISRIGAFGMTNILGGLQEASRFMPRIDAAYKHIVLISDGKETETGTDYSRVLTQLDAQKVTLSTIAVGPNPNTKLMNTLAHAGKGRFHHAKSLDEIPSAVLREAQGMEDDLLGRLPQQARKVQDDPALAGVDVDKLPPLLGYNRARARTHAWTPLVISPRNEPLLARMRYGRGQSLAFLSSAGPRWSGPWITQQPQQYAAFWRQAVLSVLPPPYQQFNPHVTYHDGRPTFSFSSDPAEGLLKAVVAAESGVAPFEIKDQLPVGDSRAVLASQTGKSISAFGWSRTYGREFDDPAKGLAAMETLCRVTGGIFRPQEDQIIAPASSGGSLTLSPAAFLIIAAVLLSVELVLRRYPVLGGLLKGGGEAR